MATIVRLKSNITGFRKCILICNIFLRCLIDRRGDVAVIKNYYWKSLKSISGVTEALAVSGQWDILTTLSGASYEEILAKTVQEISQINGIRTSETTFVYKPTVAA